MGKIIRAFFCLILCLLLTASLVASVCVLGVSQMLDEENVTDILKNVSVGEKVLGYKKAEEDREMSVGDALREHYVPQNISLLFIYGDVAQELTDAGIQGIEEYLASETDIVIHDFSKLADAFVEAYFKKAKETGILNGHVRKNGADLGPKEAYAREAVPERVLSTIDELVSEGTVFGRMSLNGKDAIFYTATAGREAAEAENAVYTSLENWYDQMYREYAKGLLYYVLRGEENADNKVFSISEEDIADLFIKIAEQNGISSENLESPDAKEEISRQINEYVLPRMRQVISDPYSTWVDDSVVPVMKVARIFLNMDLRIPLGILCGGLLLLMILIGRKMGLGFGCFSALLASAALLIAPFYKQHSLDQLSKVLPDEIQDLGITETVLDQILSFMSKYGLYCLALAGILLVLRLIAQLFTKKKSEPETEAV